MRKELVAIACTASDGAPTFAAYTVEVTDEEYDLGMHYDKAAELAMEERFEPPMVFFDSSEHTEILEIASFLKFKREHEPDED
jgi:hypothetical protein